MYYVFKNYLLLKEINLKFLKICCLLKNIKTKKNTILGNVIYDMSVLDIIFLFVKITNSSRAFCFSIKYFYSRPSSPKGSYQDMSFDRASA